MANHIREKVRAFVEEIKSKPKVFGISSAIAIFIAAFGFMTLVSADAVNSISAQGDSENGLVTISLQDQETTESTTTEKESATTTTTEETTTSTKQTTTTTSAINTTTTTTTTNTETSTTFETSNDITTEAEAIEVYEKSQNFESSYIDETSTETITEESYVYYEEERTRPYITSGQERLASMMANEGGSSDITCIRTAIGFMNRIHNSQFQYGSIENVTGYCFSTPSQHQLELAAEVIEAYNGSDSWWYNYCVEHQLTDKTVYHHNGTTVQWFEQPGGYIEYGDTGWYQWTLLYSEGIYDHY